ncbi:T9SS type B sorting domain-containing protein [Cellulophaga baltica]|uniref:T9SS type B sorting domain-containing protein n=1 Tax=Cellulophaga TaxID=104264 RepID=UPI001C07B307|nr:MULTISPECIES: T9SS type B sorting domain-containing protein [Cellulophaga]MBU2996847.1 T9SS type B sorting domain-containing protein [Cellulophaga baltica]MDO6768244.1 T9SS type B sorting domain-containing protein [Cellulophaga sp. 1_MG-2023]
MKKNYFTFFYFLFSFSFIFSQGETSNWYFGENAGITFNSDGSVTALSNGQLNTYEGCASISDDAGSLLFYTDGIRVYNRNHELMENGTGLYGDPSSTQSAIIVPKPEDPNIYYIFTVDTTAYENDPDRGLNYSTIDITANNGLGAVIQKNINLLADCSEKIAAVVKNCFDKSLWVITLSSDNGSYTGFFNTYHAFEVNPNGVVNTAVKSTFTNSNINDPRGYLKITSDGKKIASANSSSGLYIYDFDADTGIISNQEKLLNYIDDWNYYGIEFSPNQEFLYTVRYTEGENVISESQLLQLDLTASNIDNSVEILDNRIGYRGALQLGENGKIYRNISINYENGTPYLGVINNPDEEGTNSNYIHNAVALGNNNGTQGLPPFIQSFFEKITLMTNEDGRAVNALEICEGKSLTLETEYYADATYLWKKDDVVLPNTSNIYTIDNLAMTDSGEYTLNISFSDTSKCPIIGEAVISVNPLPPTEKLTLVQCDIDEQNFTDGITTVNLEQSYIFETYEEDYIFYFYENDSDLENDQPIENTINYTNTTPFNQTLIYTATNSLGCTTIGELDITILTTNVLLNNQSPYYACNNSLSDDLLIGDFNTDLIKASSFQNQKVQFYTSLIDASLEQNEIKGIYATESTSLIVRIEDGNECQRIEEIELIVNATPEFSFLETHYLCTDGIDLVLDAPTGYDVYKWVKLDATTENEISNLPTVTITESGNYQLELGYDYSTTNEIIICSSIKSFIVEPSNIAIINNIEIKDISDNNTVEVFVTGDGNYEYSLDGINYQTNTNFSNLEPGFYTVYVNDTNGCGISNEEIAIVGYPKFFTPNGDGTNDYWQIIGANEMFNTNSFISVFDRVGNLVANFSPNSKGWDGTINGNQVPASDYWFKVNLEDGRTFTGHFALKR